MVRTGRSAGWIGALGLMAVAVLPLIGCGSDRMNSPAAPTSAQATVASLSASVTTSGGNAGASLTTASGDRTPTSHEATHSDPVEGEGVVTGLVSGTACPTLSFLIGHYTIKVTTATTFSGGACGDIKVGATVNFAGTRQGDGSVVASRLSVRTATTTHPDPEVEGEGVVTGLVSGTACPTLSFLIGHYTIKVTTATTFSGGECSDVKVGTKVEVAGTRQGDGSLVASRVSIKAPRREPEPVEGEGVVTSVQTGTSCPTLEFAIERYVIKVDASTAYEGGGCADIKVGTRVHVKGALNADGSVSASHVSVKAPQHRTPEPVEGEGVVTSVRTGTSCPTLEFVLERFVIKVDASTAYEGGGCADIAVGVRLHVKGTLNADGSVMALRVILQGRKTHREDPVEGDGEVTGLVVGTACPTLKFKIREFTIAVDGSTEYVGGTCADIAVGVKVGVKGSVDADKNVTARRITFRH